MSVYMTEEEQIQAIKKWWSRYHVPILVVISLLMLAVSGYRYWNWHQEKIISQASSVYEHLMVSFSNNKRKEVRSYANELITHYGQTVYADVARMTLAKLYIEKERIVDAKKLLDQVAVGSKIPALKQIAKVRIARLMIAEKQFDQALAELAVIDDTAYMTIVNELKGDIFVQQQDFQKAILAYKQAIDEAKAQGIGNLFLEMKTNELAASTQSMNAPQSAHQSV